MADASGLFNCAFLGVLLLAVLAGHRIHITGFKYLNEGGAALVLGLAGAGTFHLLTWLVTGSPPPARLSKFHDEVFFQVLLPPIIFFAGFAAKKRMMFKNAATILLLGFWGTLASAALTAYGASWGLMALGLAPGRQLQAALALGAIGSSSDTVSILQIMDRRSFPVLHSILFGEGIVNDAVSIVLLGAVQGSLGPDAQEPSAAMALQLLGSFLWLLVSSLALGVAVGLLSAVLVRHLFHRHHDCDREVLVLGLLGFMSYRLADALSLSAILSVFFCGVTMSHYTWHSMCPAAQSLALHSFRVASNLMEMVLMAYSGMDVFFTALWRADVYTSAASLRQAASLASLLLSCIVIGRVLFVLPACAVANLLWRKRSPLGLLDTCVIAWAGLQRGAVTLALAYHHFLSRERRAEGEPAHDSQVILVSMVAVVMTTTLSLGPITGPLMEHVLRKRHAAEQTTEYPCAAGGEAALHGALDWEQLGAGADGSATAGGDGVRGPAVNGHSQGVLGAAVTAAGEALLAQRLGLTRAASVNGELPLPPPVAGPSADTEGEGAVHAWLLGSRPADGWPLHQPLLGASTDAAAEGVEERGGVHQMWRRFDRAVMQPVFGGREVLRRSLQLPMDFEHFG